MPIPFLASVLMDGWPSWLPGPWTLTKAGSALGAIAITKIYASGATCTAERNMHGRVVMITGGTSGIGAATVYELAKRGAQIILLTHHEHNDAFLVDFIDDMRDRTNNQLIYAEQVDLRSLHSVRKFATKWVDNAPPRRLDTIILCGSTLTPPGKARTETPDGVESTWQVNFLSNFHLLGILSPAIRAQPFDRDVRIIIPTCSAYIRSPSLDKALDKKDWSPGKAYARSKMAMMVFGKAYQKHLDAYKRPDELPMNARVFLVDPGYSRTPGMRRWLTRGTLWGLIVYLFLYVFSWLFLKSARMGAQSILWAVMEGSLVREKGGKVVKECMVVDCARKDVDDEAIAKKLWESSDKLIEEKEKDAAAKRARAKKREMEKEEEKKERERVEEIEALVNTIKKGKQKDKEKPKSGKKAKNGEKTA
ncbi:hypothetical protein B0T13DRAFT_461710 [Neurospora crassa]|nr:hypothetical protein B0T13DRAFT_461710 [Neurospora crassa]